MITTARKLELKAQVRALRNLAGLEGLEVIYHRWSEWATLRGKVPLTTKYEYEQVSLSTSYNRWALQIEILKQRVTGIYSTADRVIKRHIDEDIARKIFPRP